MSELAKITDSHRSRTAVVYVRQSSMSQVERNRESTARQYGLVERATALGWARSSVRVVDEDQGISASATGKRGGFEELTSEIGLGRVGIVVALEVSRLARDNLCGTASWTSPGSATHSSRTLTASITRGCSTTGRSWA